MGCRQARFDESTIEDFEVKTDRMYSVTVLVHRRLLRRSTESRSTSKRAQRPERMVIIHVYLLCSAFDRFLELYQQHKLAQVNNPDESYIQPDHIDYINMDGFINPEFSLPAEFLATHMPELKVRLSSPLSKLTSSLFTRCLGYYNNNMWLILFFRRIRLAGECWISSSQLTLER